LEDLPRAIAEHRPDEIAIALEKPSPRLVRRVVEQCRSARLEFRIVPPLSHLLTGRIEIDMLRPIEIEDLLGREPVQLETASESAPLAGKRVLVTGAGGSIGLELCRQTIAQRPAKLILLGRGENSLFEALVELKPQADKAGVELATVIGDIRDAPLIDATFDAHRPQIVFHAAAHKHVHFMQAQPAEAIKNNARGTLNVARAAARVGVERFILVSTDKAVRPVGVMGASKRVAEAIVAMIGEEAEGAFLSVRFGNVLGSRGSVIPTFRRQIAQGGPVTVTHPDVTRYFMTTAEAVSLTIEAGVRGRGGEIFLLDMGNPIRIADLARTLITLSGLEPEVDIPIVFTGLRPGEKLTEDLLTREEGVTATEHGKIFIARAEPIARERLAPALERLFAAADRGDGEEIERGLRELVPEYRAGETAEAGGGEKRAETGA
jgi:FlaA1/EpsC-like NDP-sugar epimerase